MRLRHSCSSKMAEESSEPRKQSSGWGETIGSELAAQAENAQQARVEDHLDPCCIMTATASFMAW